MMAVNPMETRLKADECADFYQSCIAAVSDDAWDRRGHASGFEFSVRSIAWIAAGHTQHHLGILRERYLGFGNGSLPA